MSTKIFTGFEIRTDDLSEILALVRAFRPWVERAQLRVWEEWWARINAERGRPDGHPDYYKDCYWPWMDARKAIKQTGYRNPAVDTDFEITLFPHGLQCYGISFVEREAWHEEWLKQPGITEFAYWNNTDGPPQSVIRSDRALPRRKSPGDIAA